MRPGRLQVQLEARIQHELVQAAHQVGQFGVIQVQGQGRGIGLTTAQLQPVPGAIGVDGHRGVRIAEDPGGAADEVAGIGGHHPQQGFEMLPFPLQFRMAREGQAPAGEDADRLAALARGDIGKPFHR